jgi:hypothetical protein
VATSAKEWKKIYSASIFNTTCRLFKQAACPSDNWSLPPHHPLPYLPLPAWVRQDLSQGHIFELDCKKGFVIIVVTVNRVAGGRVELRGGVVECGKNASLNNAKVPRNIDGAFSYQQSTYFFVNKYLFLQKNSHILSNSTHFQQTASRKLALTERTRY